MKLVLSALALSSLVSACAAPVGARVESALDGANITAWLSSIDEAPDKNGVLVRGRIEIKAEKPIASVNLNCIGLAMTKAHSQRIYVDSVASVLVERFPAEGGLISTKVYWYIPRLRPNEVDFAQARLEITNREKANGCVQYAD